MPLHGSAMVLIVPRTVPREKRPVISCTIAGAPGPALNRSLIDARNDPELEIRAALVDCTCSVPAVLQ